MQYVADNARAYWKHIARHVDLNESQIVEIENNQTFLTLSQKLLFVLKLWLGRQSINDENFFTLDKLINVLSACRLNKVKGKVSFKSTRTPRFKFKVQGLFNHCTRDSKQGYLVHNLLKY